MFRRPKHSKIEVVAPKEEEEISVSSEPTSKFKLFSKMIIQF